MKKTALELERQAENMAWAREKAKSLPEKQAAILEIIASLEPGRGKYWFRLPWSSFYKQARQTGISNGQAYRTLCLLVEKHGLILKRDETIFWGIQEVQRLEDLFHLVKF